MSWKCVVEPAPVLLVLGVYECPHCLNRIIALPETEKTQANIGKCIFCPYCGKQVVI